MFLPRRSRAAVIALAAALSAATAASANAQSPAPPPGCSGETPTGTWLNVVASGMRSGRGQLAVTIYTDNPRKFLVPRGAIWVARVDATAGTTQSCIFLPQPGVYALVLYHDENGNGKFDRSMIGLPAEGYGFTNNPATLAGLPSFRSVRLNVARSGLTTRVVMKYP